MKLTHQILTAVAVAIVLTGCGGSDAGSHSNIEVVLGEELQGEIRVTKQDFQKPGTKNPIEATVTLVNEGNREHRILLDGKWKNDSGQGFGGMNDSRTLSPGASTTFSAGSRSKGITRWILSVSSTAMDSETLAAKTMIEAKPAVPGHGLSYTDTPTLDQIPNWAPKGAANGAPFVARTLYFAPVNGAWELQLIDREMDPLKGTGFARSQPGNEGMQSIRLQMPAEPATGKAWYRKLDHGGGHFQIQESPGADETVTWSTQITWVLHITDWQRQPFDESGKTIQSGGMASGKIYACFKGSPERVADSFVAGVFENAPIVYYGNPNPTVMAKSSEESTGPQNELGADGQ